MLWRCDADLQDSPWCCLPPASVGFGGRRSCFGEQLRCGWQLSVWCGIMLQVQLTMLQVQVQPELGPSMHVRQWG